jgi:hypothetical protein
MVKYILTITTIILFTSCSNKSIKDVINRDDNIFLIYDDGLQKQITWVNMDYSPVLSHDQKIVAYLRKTRGSDIETGSCCWENNQLWMYNVNNEETTLLVESTPYFDDMKQALAGLKKLQFSPDNKYLYFMTAAWATSDAIHRVDLTTKKEQFISAGNTLMVIQNGRYKGYIVTSKHKYYNGGGSYDFYWLLTPDGDEINSIGESSEQVDNFLKINN